MLFLRPKTVFAGLVALAVRSSGLLHRPRSLLKMSTQALNVDQYLSITSYTTHGHELKLHDHTQVYACGKKQCKNGVIVIPDTLGWNTGRVRNLCDFFADNDVYAVIPNFSSKGVEGQTQSFMESSSIMDWYKSRTFDGNIKPIVSSTVNFMKNEGVEKIALLGFAWGSWVVVNLLASDIADEFVCGALSSPSIDLEEKMYGGSLPELMSRVNRPLLLMPTRGDSEHYKSYLKLLKYKVPTSKVIDYHDTEANFMLRGNCDNEAVRHAIQKSVNEIHSFFQDHFQMNPQDLVRESEEDLGPEAGQKESRSWGEYLQESGQKIKEGANQAKDRASEGMKQTGERIGENTKQAGERIGEGTKQTGERIGEGTQETGERMKQSSRGEGEGQRSPGGTGQRNEYEKRENLEQRDTQREQGREVGGKGVKDKDKEREKLEGNKSHQQQRQQDKPLI